MAFAIAKTTADELIDELNLLVIKAEYQDVGSLHIRKLLKQASDLMNANPSHANFIKAAINQICRNLDETEYHINLALRLPSENKPNLYLNCSTIYSNLSLYAKSQSFFSKIEDINTVELYQFIESGLASFSFSRMNELFIRSKKMKLKFDDERIELTSRVAAILQSNGVSDEQVGIYADVFGEVLREKKLMTKGSYPEIVVGDDTNNWTPPTVFIKFKVETDINDAANLYKAATIRLFEKFSDFPECVHFSIEAY